MRQPGHCGRVRGGDRWAGEERAGDACPALSGRRVRSQACGVPDSVLLCARNLCSRRSHFTRATGPGCNLSRTLILHIPLLGAGREEEDKGDEIRSSPPEKLQRAKEGRRGALETCPKPTRTWRILGVDSRTGSQFGIPSWDSSEVTRVIWVFVIE